MPPETIRRKLRRARATQPQPPPADDLPLLDWAQRHFPALLTCPPSSFHRALCDTLDGLRSRRGRKVCELAPRGSAKCLDADTVVLLEGGRRVRIADIQPGDCILSLNTETLRLEPDVVEAKAHSGLKPTVRVRTRSGRELLATPEHLVFTFSGWKSAGDLTTTDRIASPRRVPQFAGLEREDAEVRFTAYMVAEGSLTVDKNYGSNCSFTNFDPLVVEDFLACCAALGFGITLQRGGSCRVTCGENNPRQWARQNGLWGHSALTKRLPPWVFTLPERQRWTFVGCLLVTDGWVARQYGSVGITLANELLIDDIRDLMIQVGLLTSKIYRRNECAGAWQLKLSGPCVSGLLENCDLMHKADKLRSSSPPERYSLIDTYPGLIRRWNTLGSQAFRNAGERCDHYESDLTRAKLARLIGVEAVPAWVRLEQADVFWDQVVTVEDGGVRDTYDLQVARNHSMVTNGLVTHNSTWASFFYPLREALSGRERFTLLLSDTGAQARDYLRQITTAVQDRPDLRALYRVEPSRPWKEHHIRLSNGCEILALGTGGKVRGRKSTENRRPTLCVIDDPQNKDHIASALQRKRAWDWLTKDVLSAGEPGTNYVALGTALHRDAIVCQLQRTPGWETRTWQSIIVWPRRMDLWSEWQALLQNYDLPEEQREANALAFYRDHEREMNE